MLVVRLDPAITKLGRSHPTASRPNPAVMPIPVAAGPDGKWKRCERRHFNQHRWRSPTDSDRLGLYQRSIYIHADHWRRYGRRIGCWDGWKLTHVNRLPPCHLIVLRRRNTPGEQSDQVQRCGVRRMEGDIFSHGMSYLKNRGQTQGLKIGVLSYTPFQSEPNASGTPCLTHLN